MLIQWPVVKYANAQRIGRRLLKQRHHYRQYRQIRRLIRPSTQISFIVRAPNLIWNSICPSWLLFAYQLSCSCSLWAWRANTCSTIKINIVWTRKCMTTIWRRWFRQFAAAQYHNYIVHVMRILPYLIYSGMIGIYDSGSYLQTFTELLLIVLLSINFESEEETLFRFFAEGKCFWFWPKRNSIYETSSNIQCSPIWFLWVSEILKSKLNIYVTFSIKLSTIFAYETLFSKLNFIHSNSCKIPFNFK